MMKEILAIIFCAVMYCLICCIAEFLSTIVPGYLALILMPVLTLLMVIKLFGRRAKCQKKN